MEKSVSIIVPIYNTKPEILSNCVQSIISQNYTNYEVILVDDGSCDKIGKLCDSFITTSDKIKVFHIKNGGVSNARNFGLKKSSGEYVAFVDSDDTINENYLCTLVNELNDFVDCTVCSCKHILVDENIINNNGLYNDDKSEKTIVTADEALQSLFYMSPIFDEMEITACWGKLYKRNIIDNISFNTKISVGEDFIFNYEYFKRCKSISCISSKLYNYMIHGSSIMHGKYKPFMINTIHEFDKIIDLENNKLLKEGLIVRSINIAIVLLIMMNLKQDVNNDYEELCVFIKKYRKIVLRNKEAKVKIKLALFVSYLGFNFINFLGKKKNA